ncbi:hypothetical protein KAR91_09025 [Candidatus Pacearchaeota archaeon]|nr:hypothetical protein [Candidatus Pacearchaeota archaeon]
MKYSHTELCTLAEKWLLKSKGCSFALTEFDAAIGEIPDSIGFKCGSGDTIMVECKASRNDFLSDKNKLVRINGHLGVGKFRFYLCPEGLIKEEELPKGWGLVYVNEKGKCKQVVGPKGNIWCGQFEFHHEKHMQAEWGMMASALRRLHLCKRLPDVYLGPIGAEYDKSTS